MKKFLFLLFVLLSLTVINTSYAIDTSYFERLSIGGSENFNIPEDWRLVSVVNVPKKPTENFSVSSKFFMFFQDKSGIVFIVPIDTGGHFWTVDTNNIRRSN